MQLISGLSSVAVFITFCVISVFIGNAIFKVDYILWIMLYGWFSVVVSAIIASLALTWLIGKHEKG